MREKKKNKNRLQKKNFRAMCDKFIFFTSHDCKECVREKNKFFLFLTFPYLIFFSFLW